MCLLNQHLYVGSSVNEGGLVRFKQVEGGRINEKTDVLKNQSTECKQIHCVTAYKESIVFSDTVRKTINIVNHDHTVTTLAGMEYKDGYRDGKYGLLSQRTGLCSDMNTLYAVDTATASVIMIVPTIGLIEFPNAINNLGKVYAFSHDTSQDDDEASCNKLHELDSFLTKCTEAIQEKDQTSKTPEGPEGGFSTQTRKDVRMLAVNTRKLTEFLSQYDVLLRLDCLTTLLRIILLT